MNDAAVSLIKPSKDRNGAKNSFKYFGFHKHYIFITNNGNVVSLNSNTGEFMWRKFFPDIRFKFAEILKRETVPEPVIVLAYSKLTDQNVNV